MKRLRTRLTGMALACAGLVAAPPVKADPGTVAVVLSAVLTVETAVAVTVALYTYGAYALAGYAIYGSVAARNKAKRAAAAARAAYNAGLQDRSITALSAAPGRRIVYGRADTGGDIVAMFTTDKTDHGLDNFRGGTVVKPDAYKHLIVVWAAHQCQAIHDLKIDGIPIGALDANGWATGDEWRKSDPKPTAFGQVAGNVRSQPLPAGSTVISVTLITGGDRNTHTSVSSGAGGWSFSGTTLTLPDSVVVAGFPRVPVAEDTWDVAYSADDIDGTSTVRVRHHLGAPNQAADAELMALLPGKWTSAHRLRGRCYSWITLDLERAQFQGGPPGLTADLSGALVLDPRTGTTGWSENPALCAYDYLLRLEGMNVTTAEVDVASVIAAANACDELINFTIGSVTVAGYRYTCNGVFIAAAAKEAVLIDICEAMAGFHTYSGTWRVMAGSWTPPVMVLTDADLAGSISIVQAGEPSGELFNTVRGQYVPAQSSVPADIETYSNADFVVADGRALFTDVELPFTNSRARAKNISRIKVEQSRAGLVIFYPAKLRAWPLQTGDRVTVFSAEYGFDEKVFRVTDWQFGLRSPVGLTLQEDAPDIYDEADAAIADPTPNTDLPNPWTVEQLGLPTAASGTAQLQRLGDGTVISRVLVTWPRSTAAYMDGGRIEVAWREAGSSVTHYVFAEGLDTQVFLTGVRDGAFIGIQVTAINTQGQRSAPRSIGHQVVGKSAAPAAVQGLGAVVVPGALRVSRTPSTELDFDHTLYRHGASWAAGTAIPGQADRSGITWVWPSPGTYTIWAADVDTTGNVGSPVSFGPVAVTAAALAPSSSSLSIKLNVQDFAGSTNYSEAYIHGRDSAGNAVDAPGTIMVNGVATPVPNGQLNTNQGPAAGYIVWDSAGAAFDTGAGLRHYVLARRRAGVWEYDDNGRAGSATGWTTFTPAATHWIIGTLETGAPDAGNPGSPPGITRASIWAAASTLISQEANADAAYAAAVAAQGTADTAANNASSALGTLATMRSNGYIDAAEKPAVIKAWNAIVGEYGGIYAQGTSYGLATLRDAFAIAYGNLGTYLNALSPSWNDTTTDTPITPATDQATWAAYYTARQALLNAIADEAAKRAQWSQVSGSGKPLDNAGRVLDLGEGSHFGARNRNDGPNEYPVGRTLQFKVSSAVGLGGADNYLTLETIIQYADATGGSCYQYAYRGTTTWRRWGNRNESTWAGSWAQDENTDGSAAKAASARALAEAYALEKANLAEVTAKAYADGIVDAEEARAIADAQAKADAAQAAAISAAQADATAKANAAQSAAQAYAAAQADAADVSARAYADGIVTAEEERAIADATAKANAARAAAEATAAADATAKANVAALTAQWSGVSGAGRPTDSATRTIVTQDTYAFGGASVAAVPTVQRSISVTPTVNCTINFTAAIGASGVFPDSANYLSWAVSAGGGADTLLGACPGGTARQVFTCINSFAAAAGVTLTFKLISDRASGNPALILYDSSMRVEQVIAP